MKEIQIDELRELQMQILDYLDGFCRLNEIKYTISGGTLLGAVRHGGFIPWDDDMDIQMLRSEYDKFTYLWNQKRSEHPFELVSIESGNAMGYVFGKLHNPNTITYFHGLERTGVYIDVFPVDDVIDDADFVNRRKQISSLKRREFAAFTLATRQNQNLGIVAFLKCFLLTMGKPRTYYAAKINDIAKSKNNMGGQFVFEMVAGIKCKRPMRKSLFDDYENIHFENRTYMAVKDFDTYLKDTFGNYMQLPPENQRVREHEFIAYWK